MSASPMARQVTETKSIPTKRILINDPSELPSHYSSTPGGTLYSTTPGGTKIVYEKSFLLNLRNSPISKTPPSYGIPENLIRGNNNIPKKYTNHKNNIPNSTKKNGHNNNKYDDHEDQFQMDI